MLGKTALCLYGFLRSHRSTINKWKANVIEPLDADVFICCTEFFYAPSVIDVWASSEILEKVEPEYLQQNYEQRLKELKILPYEPEKYKKLVKDLQLPENNMLNDRGEISNIGQSNQFAWRMFSMFFHIQTVLKMCQEYQEQHHIYYDTIIISRPDLSIENKYNIEHLNPETVYSSGDHIARVLGTEKWISDHLLISKQSNIMKLLYIYDHISQFYKEGIVINQETLIGFTFLKHNIEFTRSDFSNHHLIR